MNAVITGATKGIGRAIAIKLAENGYNLAICARNEIELNELVIALHYTGVKIITSVTDCSIKNEVKQFCNFVKNNMQNVNVLVNNVGVFIPGNIINEPDDAFEYQQQLNVNTTYYFSKYFGKMMIEMQIGHIFNICSVASLNPINNSSSYCVTKAAMLSLNHVLRKELTQHQIKVTAILPGATLTSSWDGTKIPANKFVKPADIADTLIAILNLSTGANVDEVIINPLNF